MGAKNCSETPRQKMINMMYLVLTAMLALNVAAETLEAFKIVDASLITTYQSFSDKNISLIKDFNKAYEISPSKVEKWLDSATKVHSKSDSLIKYIVDIKTDLARGAGAEAKEPLEELDEKFPFIISNSYIDTLITESNDTVISNKIDTLILERQDDLNISPELMLTKGRGKELQEKIIQYKNELKSMVEAYPHIIDNLESSLDVEDPEKEDMELGDEKYRSWAQKHFTSSPVIASITLLSKLQIDVRNAESAVLRHLYNQIDASSRKVTGLNATVIPNSKYIIQGQEYRAEIFLSAEDTTQDLNVYLEGSDIPLPVEKNQAIYSITPNKPGEYSYKGYIEYKKPDGTLDRRPFERQYEVAEPAVTISPTKMNIMYRGVPQGNPISISVPGVPSNKLRPTCNNGEMYADGNGAWIVKPKNLDPTGNSTVIEVNVDFDGTIRKMGEMRFRVKDTPLPAPTLGGKTSGNISGSNLRAMVGIFTDLKDFEFDLNYIVTSFDMSVPTGGGLTTTLHSDSYQFTAEQRRLRDNLRTGDRIMIENIYVRIEDDVVDVTPRKLPSSILLTVQ